MITSKLHFCVLAILASFIVAACGSASSGSPIPFDTFIQNVAHARYSDYARLPTTKVQNEQAFEEMRAYILKRYNGVQVTSSYMTNGRTFDCIVPAPNYSNPPTPTTPGASNNFPGQSNASTSTSCENGTIPTERITLERMAQFPTLQAFLSKSPGGSSLPPVPSPSQNSK